MKKHIVIVGGALLTFPAYKIAQEELGLAVIGVDLDPNSPGMQRADVRLCLSTKDVEAVVAAVMELSKSVRICGVFTCGADVEVTVAAIAAALGLPSVSLEAASRCNNKILMHHHLDALGFTAKARYVICRRDVEAMQAARDVGFPCVVKPFDNCASRGVQVIAQEADVVAAFALAASFNINPDGQVIVEEFLAGSKHTIEMLAFEGQWHLLSIIDTHYISERWPCESLLHTTTLPASVQQQLFIFSVAAAKAMGIDFGPHKVDVNLSPDGEIKLIELTARLSGGFHCQYASPLAHGSNDIRAALKLSIRMGLDVNDINHRWNRGAAVLSIFPPPGLITGVQGLEIARSSQGVEEIFILRSAGERVGPYLNSGDRFAFVIATGENPSDAILNATSAASFLQISTEP